MGGEIPENPIQSAVHSIQLIIRRAVPTWSGINIQYSIHRGYIIVVDYYSLCANLVYIVEQDVWEAKNVARLGLNVLIRHKCRTEERGGDQNLIVVTL